ncbi:alpha/beta hydrolase fold-3 domain protein [Nostoc sp. NIES-4103]|nr:alpha/beta hydrolase fold-3 domain protein [Nostoc sp. NIES-4103]
MFAYYPVTSKAQQSILQETLSDPVDIPPTTWTVIKKSALDYREEFDVSGLNAAFKLEKYLPSNSIIKKVKQEYHSYSDPNITSETQYLDVFYPESSTTSNPTLIWIHGGGWVSGDKSQIANYIQVIASEFKNQALKDLTVVGVNYSIAPESQYPTPLLQVNNAIKYLLDHASDFHIDTSKLALAGDSAGSQIAAQIAALYTNPTYIDQLQTQNQVTIDIPTLADPEEPLIKCIVLCCGGYNLKTLVQYDSYKDNVLGFKDFVDTVTIAYSGDLDPANETKFDTFSVANYIVENFPPSFITVGNGDPLKEQSKELDEILSKLAVSISKPEIKPETFYPPEGKLLPLLPHEYQFDLDDKDGYGKQALAKIVSFLKVKLIG